MEYSSCRTRTSFTKLRSKRCNNNFGPNKINVNLFSIDRIFLQLQPFCERLCCFRLNGAALLFHTLGLWRRNGRNRRAKKSSWYEV